jgi:hypothetical protein
MSHAVEIGVGSRRYPSAVLRGPDAMLDLRDRSSLKDIRSTLSAFGSLVGDDRRTNELRALTGGQVDLSLSAHRDALLVWLRQWGCRHLRTADNTRSSRALLAWWKRHASDLPGARATLHGLGRAAFAKAGRAHADLAGRPAARRRHGDGEVDVTFGSTAAAKAMFAIRPQVLPPWDEPMRSAFGWTGLDPSHYETFLGMSKDALEGLAKRAGVHVDELPDLLGRPDSTPARIVDEYLWMRLTRGA